MRLLIVVVNYKVTDLTIDCLRSVGGEIGRVPGARVAVCENGTGEADIRKLREAIDVNGWGSWCSLTAVMPNRGFTGGNNVVLRQAMESADKPEYVLLLNADTIVLPGSLDSLVRFMDENPKAGIAGSRLEAEDGTAYVSAFRDHTITNEFDRGLRLGVVSKLLSKWALSPPVPEGSCEAQWVAGASMIIRREVFEAIGLLDEGYYTYFDDIDFCMQARKAGWPTWYVPESRVIHLVGCSTKISDPAKGGVKRRARYWYQARTRFFVKNYGAIYAAVADLAFLSGFALWRLRRRLQGKPDTDPQHMLLDIWLNSVFVSGFKLKDVENPAIVQKAA
ncbi:MAG TPA: glycosyltransferase family 2 protein [Tepidisphaeraceae bacterium]|jgi:GT2 family glycosyltransferase